MAFRADADSQTRLDEWTANPLVDEGSFRELPWGVVRSVGLKVLKNKLSEYVRLAAGGETVLVTDRDRVVAELGPPREGRSPVLDDAILADAVRSGLLSPPVLPPDAPLPTRRPVARLRQILRELESDRGDR
jgi:antitoxin (DNA-binding transcriptional repressor) of toxin-antitoxin stability system